MTSERDERYGEPRSWDEILPERNGRIHVKQWVELGSIRVYDGTTFVRVDEDDETWVEFGAYIDRRVDERVDDRESGVLPSFGETW